MELISPLRPNASWQAKMTDGYDIGQFTVNCKTKRVTCPQEKKSDQWVPSADV